MAKGHSEVAEALIIDLQRGYAEPECYEMTGWLIRDLAYKAEEAGACELDVAWAKEFAAKLEAVTKALKLLEE